MRGYPLLWAFLFFSGGIAYTYFFTINLALLLFLCGMASLISLRKKFFILVFIFLVGVFYSQARFSSYLPGKESVIKGTFDIQGHLAYSKKINVYVDRYLKDGKYYIKGDLTEIPQGLKSYLWARGFYHGLKLSHFKLLALKRSFFRERLWELYPDDVAGFLYGAIFGDKRNIPRFVKENIYRSGLGHLLAVSGLHVGLIAGVVWLLLGSFGLSPRGIFILVIAFLSGYLLLIGFQPSAIRAFMLFTFYGIGKIMGFRVNPVNALGASGLLLEIWNPFVAWDAGFQLSFTAFFFIALSLELGLSPFLLYASPQIGVLPIIALRFGYLPLASLISNFIAIPVFSIALPLAVLSLVPLIGEFLAPMVTFLIELIFFISLLFLKLFPSLNL
ncbi:MAG: ComEC/Rec2 family competence protein [Synergistetes bacterium]|nr:ComEC/Rec2 family competence protein [Synergistota bacterium]